MPIECQICDGTGSLCPTCGDSVHGCECRGIICKKTCWACDGSGDEPSGERPVDGACAELGR